MDFRQIFRVGGTWFKEQSVVQGTIWNIFVMFHLTPWTQEIFSNLFGKIRVSWQHYRKMNEWIFMKLSAKVSHEESNHLEHFQYVAGNPLNTGSIFLFCGFVMVGKIMEKWANRFSLNFHEMSRTTQEIIRQTVSRLTRLFHGLPSRRSSVSVSNITAKWMNGILWNFQDMTQEIIWNIWIFWDDVFKPLDTVFIFLFSGS